MGNLAQNHEFKAELINGKIYYISPSASPFHGMIIGNLYLIIGNYLKGKPCKVFTDTIDVYLDEENRVIPDLSVLCDKTKFTARGYEGIPRLIVEVVSPSSVKRDRIEKKALYESMQVPHYWLIDPKNKNLEIYNLIDGIYVLEDIYTEYEDHELERMSDEDRAKILTEFKTAAFEDLVIAIMDIFSFI
ncbi:MAG: Uma2 family endonuclease [Cellulosilyticaceae bacterium]